VAEIKFENGGICIDAALIAQGLGIDASLVHSMMRKGQISSLCEAGVDDDAGRFRLTFFSRSRKFRLIVTGSGKIVWRSVIDFGDRPLPPALHEPGA